jgi:NitT/TauT family transport system permease protein
VKFFLRFVLPPLVVLLIVLALAEAVIVMRGIPRYLLPRPTDVVHSIATDWRDLLASLWITARAALIGFGASVIFGLLIALLLSTSRLVQRAFYPYTIFFQTVPIVAIAPLLVIWFNPGLQSVAICAFIVSVFPVIANALTGLLSTDPALRDLFRLYGAGAMATLWKLKLPSALPNIYTGMRIAAGLAVIGTVVGEFVAGSLDEQGLGIVVVESAKLSRMDKVFAAVLAASLLGLLMLSAVNLASWLTLRRWHASEQ